MFATRSDDRSELTRLITMGLLDATGGGSRFASGLGGELLARGFATSRLRIMLAMARGGEAATMLRP